MDIYQMILSLERRLAALEAALGITPDPATIIDPRINVEAQRQRRAQMEGGE